MYETIVNIYIYIYVYTVLRIHLSERVGDGCSYRRKKMSLDVLLAARWLSGDSKWIC